MSLIDEWREFVAQARRECRHDRLPLTHQFILAKCEQVIYRKKDYTHYHKTLFMFKWCPWGWRTDSEGQKKLDQKHHKFNKLIRDLNALFGPRIVIKAHSGVDEGHYSGSTPPSLRVTATWEPNLGKPHIPMSKKDCDHWRVDHKCPACVEDQRVLGTRCGHCPRCEKEGVPRR